MLDGLNGLLDSEESDSFGESIREGSAAIDRPGVPCECVQVAMPLEMESQLLVSQESSEVTSRGSLEIDEGDVECVHLDVTVDCDQHEELQDNNGLAGIDQELDAILDDVLGDLMVMYPSTGAFSMTNISQLSDVGEDVQVLSKPNDCDIVDPQLEAILDDALTDFSCMDTKRLGMSPKVDKDVDVIMHSHANTGVRLCNQEDDKIQVFEVCLPPEEERQVIM